VIVDSLQREAATRATTCEWIASRRRRSALRRRRPACAERRAATLVGQITGGSLRGLNGAELAWVTLPESGVAVDVPLVAWMPTREMPDAGVAPDLVVTPRFEDAAAGIDTDMGATRAAIARLRAAAR
jgi:hypothetical protein